MNATAVAAVPWQTIFAKIKELIAQYGPLAVPYIEQFLAGLGIPAWALPILDSLIEMLLGQPVKALDATACKAV